MQTGNDHGINSAVQGSQIFIARALRARGNLGKAVTISPIVFLGSGSVLRDCHVGRWPPRNDKSEAFAILTVACTDCKCAAGPGCPLPYNGVCDQRDCLPEIATSLRSSQ